MLTYRRLLSGDILTFGGAKSAALNAAPRATATKSIYSYSFHLEQPMQDAPALFTSSCDALDAPHASASAAAAVAVAAGAAAAFSCPQSSVVDVAVSFARADVLPLLSYKDGKHKCKDAKDCDKAASASQSTEKRKRTETRKASSLRGNAKEESKAAESACVRRRVEAALLEEMELDEHEARQKERENAYSDGVESEGRGRAVRRAFTCLLHVMDVPRQVKEGRDGKGGGKGEGGGGGRQKINVASSGLHFGAVELSIGEERGVGFCSEEIPASVSASVSANLTATPTSSPRWDKSMKAITPATSVMTHCLSKHVALHVTLDHKQEEITTKEGGNQHTVQGKRCKESEYNPLAGKKMEGEQADEMEQSLKGWNDGRLVAMPTINMVEACHQGGCSRTGDAEPADSGTQPIITEGSGKSRGVGGIQKGVSGLSVMRQTKCSTKCEAGHGEAGGGGNKKQRHIKSPMIMCVQCARLFEGSENLLKHQTNWCVGYSNFENVKEKKDDVQGDGKGREGGGRGIKEEERLKRKRNLEKVRRDKNKKLKMLDQSIAAASAASDAAAAATTLLSRHGGAAQASAVALGARSSSIMKTHAPGLSLTDDDAPTKTALRWAAAGIRKFNGYFLFSI